MQSSHGDIDAAGGRPLVIGGADGTAGFAALWREVDAAPDPGRLPPLPFARTVASRPSPEALSAGRQVRRWRAAALFVGFCAAVLAVDIAAEPDRWPLPLWASVFGFAALTTAGLAFAASRYARASRRDRFSERLDAARADWDAFRTTWQAQNAASEFRRVKHELDLLKARHETVEAERNAGLWELDRRLRDRQLREHLARLPIAMAAIPGLTKRDLATLSAAGVATAADVTDGAVRAVSGLKPATVGRLVAWRRDVAENFEFDPEAAALDAEVAILEREFADRRAGLQSEAEIEIGRLKAASAATAQNQSLLKDKAVVLLRDLAQATADANAVPRGERLYKRIAVIAGLAVLLAATLCFAGGGRPPEDIGGAAGNDEGVMTDAYGSNLPATLLGTYPARWPIIPNLVKAAALPAGVDEWAAVPSSPDAPSTPAPLRRQAQAAAEPATNDDPALKSKTSISSFMNEGLVDIR